MSGKNLFFLYYQLIFCIYIFVCHYWFLLTQFLVCGSNVLLTSCVLPIHISHRRRYTIFCRYITSNVCYVTSTCTTVLQSISKYVFSILMLLPSTPKIALIKFKLKLTMNRNTNMFLLYLHNLKLEVQVIIIHGIN